MFTRGSRPAPHVYVCGDAERMAPDVHAALIDIIETHGGLDRDGAEALLSAWRTSAAMSGTCTDHG